MDISLLPKSQELDGVIASLIDSTTQELNKLMQEIEELNVKLQGKEMRVDRSENADFQIANDARAMKTAMANLLNKRIESISGEIGSYTPTGFITLGTTVELSVISVDGKPRKLKQNRFIFKLVKHDTSNSLLNLVAIDSLVGAALQGRTVGEEVLVDALGGQIKYKIERIY